MRWISGLLLFWAASSAHAACFNTSFLNPITDISWECIFPITVMGIPFDFGNHPPDQDTSDMFCECPGDGIYGFGFVVSFWEPARAIDTVSDAWCFPTLGVSLGAASAAAGFGGDGALSKSSASVENLAFQHYHYYIMPIFAIMDVLRDVACAARETEFDLAMVSEVRPDWHSDLTALQLFPETALMANVGPVMACVADAVAATFNRTIDALYWCMGAWETTYPATGHVTVSDYVEANAAIAGRAMYVQARTAMLTDMAVNYCAPTPMPIWIKSHWRLQQTRPKVDRRCHAIGHPGLLWTARKNPVGRGDNFSWALFRKVKCCVVLF